MGDAPLSSSGATAGRLHSANGGYAAGLVARARRGPVEVTLRLPPPLDTPLDVRHATVERSLLLDGDALVAEARAGRARARARRCAGSFEARAGAAEEQHVRLGDARRSRECFSCGTRARRRTASRSIPGRSPEREPLHARAVDGASRSPPEVVWAAIDCSARTPSAGSVAASAAARDGMTAAGRSAPRRGRAHASCVGLAARRRRAASSSAATALVARLERGERCCAARPAGAGSRHLKASDSRPRLCFARGQSVEPSGPLRLARRQARRARRRPRRTPGTGRRCTGFSCPARVRSVELAGRSWRTPHSRTSSSGAASDSAERLDARLRPIRSCSRESGQLEHAAARRRARARPRRRRRTRSWAPG